jgi:hypothetical protein
MKRRTVLSGVATATVLLAGCVSDGEPSDDGWGDDPDGNQSADSDTHPALVVFDEFLQAATDRDVDALERYLHSAYPVDPERLEDDSNASFTDEIPEEYERELLATNVDTDTLREKLSQSPFGDGADLAALTDGERAALVEVTHGRPNGSGTVSTRFVVLTEDDDWRVYLPYSQSGTVPERSETDDYDVVERIEYNTETNRAKVNFSGLDGVEAEAITIYSESLGEDSRAWAKESDTLPPLTYLTAPFDPDGDELVVTLTVDGEETVVYRERYQPE